MKKRIIILLAVALLCLQIPVYAEEAKLIPPYHWTYHSLASLCESGLIKEEIIPGKSAFTPEQTVSLIVMAVKHAENDVSKFTDADLSALRQLSSAYKANFKSAGFEYAVIRNDIEMLALRAGLVSDGASQSTQEEKIQSAKGAEAVNTFAFELCKKIAAESDENFFISPYSISSAMGMLYAGANGETEYEIAKVFHFSPDIHKSMNTLMREIGSVPRSVAEFSAANALWPAKNFKLLPEFAQTVRQNYGAGLGLLNYAANPENARNTINKWTDTHTYGKIKNIISDGMINKATELVLTNAVYFKSPWEREFEPYNTDRADFAAKSGTCSALMMKQTFDGMNYANAGYAEIAELPYKGGHFSMFVLLPSKKSGIDALVQKINGTEFSSLCKKMKPQTVTVYLPRFKTENTYELSQIIAEMGAPSPFNADTADFTGITGSAKISVGNVVHKTFIGIAEEGTEAAAATSIIINRISAKYGGRKNIVFKADRPFLYVIRENTTGTVIFVGKCEKP